MTKLNFMTNDEELQDYIDGRLDDRRRAEIAAYLTEHPQKASEVEALRLQDDTLRSLGADILSEPVPQRLQAVVRSATRAPESQAATTSRHPKQSVRLLEAAAALFIFVLGAGVGWGGHTFLKPGPSELDTILSDASFAFSYMTSSPDPTPFEFGPDQDDIFGDAVERVFGRQITRPDLSEIGYDYTGARILPSARRQMGYFFFQSAEGSRFSIIFWPSELHPNRQPATRTINKVISRSWIEEGIAFSVLSQDQQTVPDELMQNIVTFYEDAFTSQ